MPVISYRTHPEDYVDLTKDVGGMPVRIADHAPIVQPGLIVTVVRW